MSRWITIILLILAGGITKAHSDNRVSEANTLYENKEFEKAASLYQEIIEDGYVAAGLYYNLGNAQFEQQEIGLAILNYERALRLDPGNEDILHNLQFARTKTRDRIEYKERKSLGNVFTVFMTSLSPNTFGWLTVGLWVLGFAGLMIFLFTTGRTKRITFYSGIATLVLAILLTVFSLRYKSYLDTSDAGIVLDNITKVRQAPSENGELVFELHEGTKVEVLEESEGWYRVDVNGEMDGWVVKSAVEKI